MITFEESGLSLENYEKLKLAESGATWSITAHRFNLNFTEVGTDQGRDNTLPNFDAAVCSSTLFRIIESSLLERFNAASSVWEPATGYTGLGGSTPIYTDSAQIAVNGSDMFIFVASDTGIWMQSTSDLGNTFTTWSQVTSDTDVNKIAVVNKDRVHYTVMDTAKNIYNLRVAKNASGWTTANSDVWYTFPFSNFVAAELPDGSDMIVAATQVPGVTTVKLVVNVPTSYIKQQGGIIGFKYSNNWWGDHYDIDVVDELTAYRYRDRIKLTQFSDRVALTCYSSDGTQLFPYTMYRIYTTVDGKHWSKGNALPLPESPGASGAKLCQLGDYVYAIEKSRAYKSLMTLQLGYSPTVCQIEIPHRRINSLQLGEGDMMQGSLTLSNEDGWLDDNAIISKQARTILYFRMGYWVNGVKIDVQTNIGEVDTYDMSKSLPRSMVKLTFRDFMSWMTDINAAERPYYWDSQLLGGDNFVDTTNDKYGGLRHLEPQAGSFTSENSVLNLTSNNEEGVGFSTFSLYLWNGITQSQFRLSTVGNGEYGGVTFRSADKDNFWTAYYNQTDDTIKLVERSGGVADIKVTTSALSWSGTPETPRWIQVEFRYAHIIVRYSTDGFTWTDCIDYLMPIVIPDSTPDLTPLANSNKERGYVGFIGKGYAPPEVDTWPDDPLPYDPPDFYVYEPPYFPPYDPGYLGYYTGSVYVPGAGSGPGIPGTGLTTTGNPTKVLTVCRNGDIWRGTSLNANTGSISWVLAATIPHPVIYYKKDPKKASRRWFTTDYGLYVCENIWATTPVITLRATNAAMFNDSSATARALQMSEKRPSWIIAENYEKIYSISENLGNLWDCLDITNASSATGLSTYPYNGGMAVPYGSAGEVFAIVTNPNIFFVNYESYVSADWGRTFTLQGSHELNPTYRGDGSGKAYSPYRRKSGSVNTVNSTHELYYITTGSDGVAFAFSNNKGASLTEQTGSIASPGLDELKNPAWYVTSIPLYGDQLLYNNTKTYKRKYMVIRERGNANHKGIVYSVDNWASYDFVPGFTYGFDASFGNTDQDAHIVGYPSNWNFLIWAQEAKAGASGHRGNMKLTPNLGANWFDITPPVTDVPTDWSESQFIAVDCE